MSMMAIPAIETTVNWTIWILSLCACAVIAKTYHIKAQYSGVTNVLFENRNILTSPYFFHMAFEIILWNIQTPPILIFWKPFFRLINYFIFLRLYSIVIYLNNAVYVYRTFCRAMAAISDLPLSTSFLIRTSMVYHKTRVGLSVIFLMWLTVGFMYAKAETVAVSDGLWFSFQTLATLGYGDFTPITVGGRAVAFIAWLFSFFIMAYLIVVGQMILKDTDYNMQLLSYCHDLTHQLHTRSAWTIQVAWALRKAQKQRAANPGRRAELKVLLLSWKLTHVIAALRRTRQSLNANQKSFRETQVNPLTGLSAYQYNQFVYETHAAARRLQRVKDVDRVYLTLRDRDIVASSLTRKDIEEMIIPTGSNYLEEESALQAANELLFGSGSGGGGIVQTVAATGLSAEEVEMWKKKVQTLEDKITLLGETIDALSAIAVTHPPSMSHSQV
ncbi:ion transport protein-like protein [Strigomonas culicis]|nr:ion transport protein-like protein [Strigomonas culicis]|eukprot:EPY33345.1 ion transport protein-like protein [Strigomonas culicis]